MKALVIFSKYPEPGKSKTRLGKTIGHENAAEIHMKCLQMLFKEHSNQDYDVIISSPFEEDREKFKKITKAKFLLQKQGSLGEKMLQCFKEILQKYKKVTIIGSDFPTLSSETVKQAFSLLDEHDIILGPSFDGGYYLIAMQQPHTIFKNIEWSVETVLQEQIKNIEKQKLTFTLLKKEHDIDTEEDLQYFPEIT